MLLSSSCSSYNGLNSKASKPTLNPFWRKGEAAFNIHTCKFCSCRKKFWKIPSKILSSKPDDSWSAILIACCWAVLQQEVEASGNCGSQASAGDWQGEAQISASAFGEGRSCAHAPYTPQQLHKIVFQECINHSENKGEKAQQQQSRERPEKVKSAYSGIVTGPTVRI